MTDASSASGEPDGDAGGKHQPGEDAIARRAVVEEDDVTGLLTTEGEV